MKEQLLERLQHCFEETEKELKVLEEQYAKLPYGTMAIDTMLKIERKKGELFTYKDIRVYIKSNTF